MCVKGQKMQFLDIKYLLFSGIFLSGIGGTPLPPLTENHPAQKPLAKRGGKNIRNMWFQYTLALHNEKNHIDSVLQDLFTLSEKEEQVDVYFSRISSCRNGSAVSCVWSGHGVWSGQPTGSPLLPPFQGFVHNIDVGKRLFSTTRMWYKFNFCRSVCFWFPSHLFQCLPRHTLGWAIISWSRDLIGI